MFIIYRMVATICLMFKCLHPVTIILYMITSLNKEKIYSAFTMSLMQSEEYSPRALIICSGYNNLNATCIVHSSYVKIYVPGEVISLRMRNSASYINHNAICID